MSDERWVMSKFASSAALHKAMVTEINRLNDGWKEANVKLLLSEKKNSELGELCGEAYRTFKSVNPSLPILKDLAKIEQLN